MSLKSTQTVVTDLETPKSARQPMGLLPIAAIVVVAFVGASGFKRWNSSMPVTGSTATAQTTPQSPSREDGSQVPHSPRTERKPADNSPRDPDQGDTDLVGLGFKILKDGAATTAGIADEVMGLTAEEERSIGREANLQIRRSHKVQDRSPQVDLIQKLAQPFLAARKRRDLDYQFFIVEDASINAFAHLGGYVYVHTGLLKEIRGDDELSFVIGHEIAHCEHRHSVKNMTLPVRAGKLAGREEVAAIAAMAWKVVALGYSEDYEYESDQWSYEQMRRQGLPHDRCLLGLQMLGQAARTSRPSSPRSEGPTLIKHVCDHFRSHPEIADRIARLNRLRKS